MKEQFIPYDLALQLKNLDFDEKCLMYISHSGDSDYFTKERFRSRAWLNGEEMDFDYKFPEYGDRLEEVKIPLWQQAFDWFYWKHRIKAEPINFIGDKVTYRIHNENYNTPMFHIPEEARQACLEKIIEIVKENDRNRKETIQSLH